MCTEANLNQIFDEFDCDQDGFVSQGDMELYITNILTRGADFIIPTASEE